jgi:Kef-type K+ transport system membrane component KefB
MPVHTLLLVLAIAAAAPVIAEATHRVGVPIVVLEILLGVAIGEHGFGWAAPEGVVSFLAIAGLAFLLFLAGMEIDFSAIRGRPLNLAIAGWSIGIVLASLIAIGMRAAGLLDTWFIAATALMTTSLGVLVPILRDKKELETAFGRNVIAVAAMGELGPILTISLALSVENRASVRVEHTLLFIALVLVIAWLLVRSRDLPGFLEMLRRGMKHSGQLPVRLVVLLLGVLTVLADTLGTDLAFGALAAGMVTALATRGLDTSVLHLKLDAIGFGFLTPIFFIYSGMTLNFAAAFSEAAGLLLALTFLVSMIAVRLPTVLLFKRDLGSRRSMALGLYGATSLGLVVVLTQIGMKKGLLTSAEAAALVGGAVLSLLLFPVVAARLIDARVPKARIKKRSAV